MKENYHLRLIFIIIILIFIYIVIPEKKVKEREVMKDLEKRAVFISYIEISNYLKGKDIATMKNTIDDMLDKLADFKLNMVMLQVRSFSDAIYQSSIFPTSRMLVEKEGDKLPFDVLDYFIKQAHKRLIEIHAWINPYRIRNHVDMSGISEDNPAFKWLNTNKVKEIEKGLFYNPAEKEVEALILEGIKEILDNYEVDGIHFDDYFYPDETIDSINYQEAMKIDEDLDFQKYRLSITTSLIKKTYQLVKKKSPKLLFGISPEGNIDNNYTSNYIDTMLFGSTPGYVDYLMPQIYYGFLNGSKPYQETLEQWNSLIKNDNISLIPALAFYKAGTKDNYAKDGVDEWTMYHDIIKREVLSSRNISSYGGFAIYRYDSIFNDNLSQAAFLEKENLKSVLN